MVPVHPDPDPAAGYNIYAVTFRDANGAETTRLFNAIDAANAAEQVTHLDFMSHAVRGSIDVRECLSVQTFNPRVSVTDA